MEWQRKKIKAGEARKRRDAKYLSPFAFASPITPSSNVSSDSDGDGGAKQPLQQSRRGDMDDDGGFHPAARPPFVCGLIYVSAVTSSAEQA